MVDVQLKVGDARQQDVNRGIARIDQKTMEKLGVKAGDVIEISGKKTTAAIVWPAYSEDQDQELIRIDGLTRKNAGAALNESVTVRPADVKDASSITLEPVDMQLIVDQDFMKFVKNRLVERAFVEGDTTLVMMLGQAIPFTVTKAQPTGVVKMTYGTELRIEGPLVKMAGGPLVKIERLMEKRDNTVMTRLSDEDLKQIDILIGVGLFDSRSEAVAYLTHEGIAAKREMFGQLTEKLEQISKIRDEAKALLGTSAPVLGVKECPKCGKANSQDAKFCSNCGQPL